MSIVARSPNVTDIYESFQRLVPDFEEITSQPGRTKGYLKASIWAERSTILSAFNNKEN